MVSGSDGLVAQVVLDESSGERSTQYLHQTGSPIPGGWRATVDDAPESYLAFGPYAENLPDGQLTAQFWLAIDNNTADNLNVARIDVFDSTAQKILASRELYRLDWSLQGEYQPFGLMFDNAVGHLMEFRVFYHHHAAISFDRTDVLAVPEPAALASLALVWATTRRRCRSA